MTTTHFDANRERQAARELMIPRVEAAAEVMGGRKLSAAALGVLAERAARDPEVGVNALRWLSENDNGNLTLAKLMKAMQDIGAQSKMRAKTGGGCVANGCPMPGTITTGGAWRCRYHLDTPDHGPQADAVTNVLRQNLEAVELVQRLANEPGAPAWEAFQKVEHHLMTCTRKADAEAVTQMSARAKASNSIDDARTALVKRAQAFVNSSRFAGARA